MIAPKPPYAADTNTGIAGALGQMIVNLRVASTSRVFHAVDLPLRGGPALPSMLSRGLPTLR